MSEKIPKTNNFHIILRGRRTFERFLKSAHPQIAYAKMLNLKLSFSQEYHEDDEDDDEDEKDKVRRMQLIVVCLFECLIVCINVVCEYILYKNLDIWIGNGLLLKVFL